MNWDQIAGKWEQAKGQLRRKWGELTDDEVDQIKGDREVLVGTLQERYGFVREEAVRRADEWAQSV
jgi:uncharacterized protein YjbJ (UPF0337 family)